MEVKLCIANLAILDPMAKMVCRFEMRIERYGRAALHCQDLRSNSQDSSLFKQEKNK